MGRLDQRPGEPLNRSTESVRLTIGPRRDPWDCQWDCLDWSGARGLNAGIYIYRERERWQSHGLFGCGVSVGFSSVGSIAWWSSININMNQFPEHARSTNVGPNTSTKSRRLSKKTEKHLNTYPPWNSLAFRGSLLGALAACGRSQLAQEAPGGTPRRVHLRAGVLGTSGGRAARYPRGRPSGEAERFATSGSVRSDEEDGPPGWIATDRTLYKHTYSRELGNWAFIPEGRSPGSICVQKKITVYVDPSTSSTTLVLMSLGVQHLR